MNMRVKLFVDLVAQTKGPTRAVKRDILDLKRAAHDLGRQRGSNDMARDLDRLGRSAQRTRREFVRMALEARKARRSLQMPMAAGGAPKGSAGAGAGGTAILPGTRNLLAAGVSLYALKKALNATVGSAISFEAAMADVKKKVDLPVGQTWEELEKTITKNAISFGRSREEIAALVAEAGAAGIAYEELTAYTKLATKAAIGWDMTAAETSQTLAEIKASTGWTIAELEVFADKVNALGDSSAAKEKDIVEMFLRSAAAAKAAGVSYDISLASLTALRSSGMREEVSARFFGNMTGKLRTATHLPKKAAQGFKLLGTSAKAVEKGMKGDALATMLDLFKRLENSPEKAAAAIKIFGQEWWDEASRVPGVIPEIIKHLKMLQDPKNYSGSLEKNLNIELATTANHLERLKALSSDVGDRLGRWALPGINDTINKLVEVMDRIDSGDTWYQRQLKYNEEKNRAYREATGQPEPQTWDHDTEQRKIEDWLDQKGLGWLQPFRKSRSEQQNKTGADAAWEGRQDGINRAWEERNSRESGKLHQINQTRSAALSERQRLAVAPQRPETQQRIAELDAAIARSDAEIRELRSLLQSRQADNSAELSRSRRGPIFGLSGPNVPHGGMSGIGRTDARTWFDLGLGGRPISSGTGPGGSDAGAQAGGIANNVRSALDGSDLAAAGRQAMDKYAAGLLSGGDAAVQAAASVAGRVNAALSTAGTGGGRAGARLSGQLHDGATGQ